MYRTDVGAGESSRLKGQDGGATSSPPPIRDEVAARSLKRGADVVVASMFLILFLWLYVAVWLLVMLTTGSPVIYRHERVGMNGRRFQCLKFRSMVNDSDRVLADFLDSSSEARDEWYRTFKLKRDPRITRFGRFIRNMCLDELPQFWNVLRGDMSLVGPRPVTQSELDRYYGKCASEYMRVRPGLTGPWQIGLRHQENYEARVALDVQYVNNWSFWLDVKIFAKTLRVVLAGQDAN
jgi:lipopolysaccharide/colanic/teichoic acid biosynthesis glycosyltransferase